FGLVLRNILLYTRAPGDTTTPTAIMLGNRSLAEEMSVPYIMVNGQRVRLAPAGYAPGTVTDSDGQTLEFRTRLIAFQIDSPGQRLNSTSGTLVIEATYLIDRIPGMGHSCLHVTQRYEFRAETDPSQGGDKYEPSGSVAAARFRPITSYQFFPE